MSDAGTALIGPNAILQYLPVLDAALGRSARDALLQSEGIDLPDGRAMIPEAPAARLHQAVRRVCPDRAAGLAFDAGTRTADYILAHRIPSFAQTLLRPLPARLAAPVLARAIAKHAWTFAGSGAFHVDGPWHFTLSDNPVVRHETANAPLCHWHAAVFQRLYRVLVHPSVTCTETACCATGAGACHFRLTLRA